MPLIYLVRHGESEGNLSRRLLNWIEDVPLTPRGQVQAEQVARWLGSRPVARIYTSTLRRARQTAELIAEATGAPVSPRAELVEIGYGDLDGRERAEVNHLYQAVVTRWVAGDIDEPFPGGESLADAHTRLSALLIEIQQSHPSEDVVLVGHTMLFSLVIPLLCRVPGHEVGARLRLRNSAVAVLAYQADDLHCQIWDSVEHLTVEEQAALLSSPYTAGERAELPPEARPG